MPARDPVSRKYTPVSVRQQNAQRIAYELKMKGLGHRRVTQSPAQKVAPTTCKTELHGQHRRSEIEKKAIALAKARATKANAASAATHISNFERAADAYFVPGRPEKLDRYFLDADKKGGLRLQKTSEPGVYRAAFHDPSNPTTQTRVMTVKLDMSPSQGDPDDLCNYKLSYNQGATSINLPLEAALPNSSWRWVTAQWTQSLSPTSAVTKPAPVKKVEKVVHPQSVAKPRVSAQDVLPLLDRATPTNVVERADVVKGKIACRVYNPAGNPNKKNLQYAYVGTDGEVKTQTIFDLAGMVITSAEARAQLIADDISNREGMTWPPVKPTVTDDGGDISSTRSHQPSRSGVTPQNRQPQSPVLRVARYLHTHVTASNHFTRPGSYSIRLIEGSYMLETNQAGRKVQRYQIPRDLFSKGPVVLEKRIQQFATEQRLYFSCKGQIYPRMMDPTHF